MNFFEKILKALDGQMTTPTSYGWFHLMWIGIVIGLCVLVALKCRKLNSKQFRTITIIVASVLILFEIYKQLNFSFNSSTGEWHYQWYAFPFQFCSTPMYVLLLIGLLKENKFSNWLCSFMATFGLFAGVVVMLYPNDVFISTIGINIQTMLHHGMMIVMGVFMIATGRAKLEHKTILKGMAVFGALVATAFALNLTWYLSVAPADKTYYFNMFYISPFVRCHLPVLGNIWDINYVLFLVSYLFGFSLAGYLMILIPMGIKALIGLIKNSKKEKVADNEQKVDSNEKEENNELKEPEQSVENKANN